MYIITYFNDWFFRTIFWMGLRFSTFYYFHRTKIAQMTIRLKNFHFLHYKWNIWYSFLVNDAAAVANQNGHRKKNIWKKFARILNYFCFFSFFPPLRSVQKKIFRILLLELLCATSVAVVFHVNIENCLLIHSIWVKLLSLNGSMCDVNPELNSHLIDVACCFKHCHFNLFPRYSWIKLVTIILIHISYFSYL